MIKLLKNLLTCTQIHLNSLVLTCPKNWEDLIFIFILSITNSCSTTDCCGNFHSRVLISSTGEKIYVNSINWGVTDDYQLSVISRDSLRLKERNDSVGSVQGLNPFIYQFNSDTLTLFFYKTINYKLKDRLKSITVIYKVVDESEYLELTMKSDEKSFFFSVPQIP